MPMPQPPVRPWAFLARLLVFFFATYLLWQPSAPYYTQFLLHAARFGAWLSELPTSSLWRSGTTLRAGNLCIGQPIRGAARACGEYCESNADCPPGVACSSGLCDVSCKDRNDCMACGAGAGCQIGSTSAIFYYHRNFKAFEPPLEPQRIP